MRWGIIAQYQKGCRKAAFHSSVSGKLEVKGGDL